MQLKVRGKGALTRNQIKTAIPYMMKLMNSHRILDNSEILVKFEHLDCHATCYMHEPGEFEISLSNKLNSKKCLFALAHELVHVKQFARKELEMGMYQAKFKSVVYDLSKIHYYDLPFEIEAHGREEGLVSRYCQYVRSQQKTSSKVAKKTRTKSI
tara:strand:- start:264 stop:731 length:468 start_codon:yes stop_codon:yes gene_type:complete